MLAPTKLFLSCAVVVSGAAALCPVCADTVDAARAGSGLVTQAPDTATTRLHISRMTCGTCPITARVALKKLAGVYAASVTLDDSLGVVRYDPRRLTPVKIADHLTRLTGFPAAVLPDSARAARKPDA